MDQSRALLLAAREGNVEGVRHLLSKGADPNVLVPDADDHGAFLDAVTPLMAAAGSPRSNAETVRALLDGGADPFMVSPGKVTALWYAAGGGTGYALTEQNLAELIDDHPFRNWGGGDVDRMRLLLDAGLSANEWADNGRTAVGEACSVGNPERVQLLIEHRASVWPSKPEAWYTPVPLFLAAESGSLPCVQLILDQGFPPHYVHAGKNALNYASTVEIGELFLNLGVKPQSGSCGFDAIDEAFDNDRIPVGLAMIRRIEDSQERQRVLNQKLTICSGVQMNPNAARQLIAEGAEVNRVDQSFGSALHYACWQGDGNGGRENEIVEQVLKILLDAGADPNLMANGLYPLHEAVQGDWGSPTSVRVLLEHGAKVDALNSSGETPLVLAASRGEVECIRLLLYAGAEPKPAIHHAKKHVKVWKRLASESPGKIYKFLKSFGMDIFGSVEETLHQRQKALQHAEEALLLLEEASKGP
jgi:ankyrin repeat protein